MNENEDSNSNLERKQEKFEPQKDNCIICFEELSEDKFEETDEKVVELECKHVFHLKCLQHVIGKLCPLCRAPMPYGKEPV